MISKYSTVETDKIGTNVNIAEYCVIRENVTIGNDVVIHPNVVIYSGVNIEDGTEIFSGSVLGKIPKAAGSSSRKLNFKEKTNIGKFCAVGPHAVIYTDVVIGDNCLIGDTAAIRENCRIGNDCIIGRHVSLLYNIEVGNNTVIMTKSHLSGNTKVGKHVFISVGVNSVNDNLFGEKGYAEHVVGQTIEDYVKIGAGAILLPNITIGRSAIIAAGAVVTKSVKSGQKVFGIPAK